MEVEHDIGPTLLLIAYLVFGAGLIAAGVRLTRWVSRRWLRLAIISGIAAGWFTPTLLIGHGVAIMPAWLIFFHDAWTLLLSFPSVDWSTLSVSMEWTVILFIVVWGIAFSVLALIVKWSSIPPNKTNSA
jgi:hypothetical protein